MVFDLGGGRDGSTHFEAITSLKLCFNRPEYWKILNRLYLRIGPCRIGIHKAEFLDDLVVSEDGMSSVVVFSTWMPLPIGYMPSYVVQMEVHVQNLPDDLLLTLMVSHAKLKSPRTYPTTCYYTVFREMGMPGGNGNITGLALRVPFRKALKVTHVRLFPPRAPVFVEIDMKWMRYHHHDFPVPLDPTSFILIPPLSRSSLPPNFRACDRFYITYKYDDDVHWEVMGTYGGYFLHPQLLYFHDEQEMCVIY